MKEPTGFAEALAMWAMRERGVMVRSQRCLDKVKGSVEVPFRELDKVLDEQSREQIQEFIF